MLSGWSANRKPCTAGQLVLNPLSDNVGPVNWIVSVLHPALGEERHFALSEKVPNPTKARSQSF